jgi:AcrR family transcriptional regulator
MVFVSGKTKGEGRVMRKSDRTRAGILEAARAMFAEHGYEGTTVRAIAERASIDPSMIIRYFGGKDGLFSLASKVELGLPDINPTAPVPVGAMLVGISSNSGKEAAKTWGL